MSLSLVPGGKAGLHATAYSDIADTIVDTEATVAWSSDNEAVATVADLGTTAGVGACTVTAVAAGTCNITATATDADGHSVSSVPHPCTVHGDAVAVVITEDASAAPAPTPAPAPAPAPAG